MTHTDIVKKLIGPISPCGESNTDEQRLQNLKNMCELTSDLIAEINEVYEKNKHSKEYSVKLMSDLAERYLISF